MRHRALKIKRPVEFEKPIMLRLCPFCGEKAKYSTSRQWLRKLKHSYKTLQSAYMVHCTKCFAKTKYHRSEQEAVEGWNRRTK